jgi:rSAM/selenodomain-associated transferase 2/rSAM/selenodomain-associated transferase 1
MPEDVMVSVIIPVWRDEAALARTLACLQPPSSVGCDVEVIVAFALGEASRYEHVRRQHPAIQLLESPRGRASQMNTGAAVARGRWLLFLHADSELPAGWLDVIRQVDERTDVAGGAFTLALDSRDSRARVVEAGVRLRVALFGLPYGDQALFVRSRIFRAIGRYRDLPLMEDVDLVWRVKRVGHLVQSRAVVLTSARRWERDGWIRRSAWNAFLATRFLLGVSPARLAQRYFARKAAAVIMMARAPWTGGKTRLAVAGDDAAHDALRHALFLDTLDVVTSVRNVEHIIACEPPGACERMREFAGPTVDVVAQRGGHLGQRIAHVFEDTFRLGVESVAVVGSDLPDLPSRLLQEALAALRGRKDRVVLGPAGDGGYYLIGLNRPHPELFDRIEWSTGRVLTQTLDAAKTLGVRTMLLDRWTDVDDAADLSRFLSDPADSTGRRTRACAFEHLAHRSTASQQSGQAADPGMTRSCGNG